MLASAFVKGIIQWFIETFGPQLLVITSDKLKSHWSKTLAAHPIVILGPKGTGKSSLILFLEKDQPFEVIDGVRRTPAPTLGAAIINNKYNANKDVWLKIKKDVPGDEQMREYWHQMIKEVRPHGIVYMLNGSDLYDNDVNDVNDAAIETSVHTIFTDVLDHFEDADKILKSFSIFISFSDLWSTGNASEKKLQRAVEDRFETRLGINKKYENIKVNVRCVHLSPHREQWVETRTAMNFFAVHLQGR